MYKCEVCSRVETELGQSTYPRYFFSRLPGKA